MQDSESQSLSHKFIEVLLNLPLEAALDFTREQLAKGINPVEFFQAGVHTQRTKSTGEQFGRLETCLPELIQAADTAKEWFADQVVPPAIPKDPVNARL